MPDEKKEWTAVEQVAAVDAISARAAMLKKAGVPTIVILLVTAASIPGVWSFFDNTGTEAKVKAEVSYALLKAQSEAMAEMVKDNRNEIKALRDMVTDMLMQRSGRVPMTDLRLPRAPEPEPAMTRLPANLDTAIKSTAEGKEAMSGAGLDASDLQ